MKENDLLLSKFNIKSMHHFGLNIQYNFLKNHKASKYDENLLLLIIKSISNYLRIIIIIKQKI